MQFAAALVEYLIIGAIALVWAAPLGSHFFGLPLTPDQTSVIFVTPFIYVIGMYIDAAASVLLKKWKKNTKEATKEATEGTTPQAWTKTVQVLTHSPELSQTMNALVTRDRVARGTFLNSVIAIFVPPMMGMRWSRWAPLSLTAIGFSVVAFLAWRRFDRLSFDFKQKAIEQIKLKLSLANKDNQGTP